MTKTKEKPKALEMTGDQAEAVRLVLAFVKGEEKKKLLTLGGYAGTGKTTTISEAVRRMSEWKDRPTIAFCAFTGRAASVLRWKLEAAGVFEMTDYAGTIHSLIYKPKVSKGVVVGWEKREKSEFQYDVIMVDEASMLNETIFNDLASYDKPILAVGDHGQLPPIDGAFNLMANPEIRLERIHRQAEGDPIIKLSMIVREGGSIPIGRHGEFVTKTNDRRVLDRVPDLSDVMVLCGYNRTRVALNTYVRNRLGIAGNNPQKGEKIICLKNNRDAGVYNGMIGRIRSISDGDANHYTLDADMEDGTRFMGAVWRGQFGAEKTCRPNSKQEAREVGDLFDFGYAMTVHKSQGSEAKRVVVFEERLPKSTDEDWKRWLYTAVTRARERLLVIGG